MALQCCRCFLQSTLVDFPYLRDVWRANTSAERLLGVSLTGIMDNTLMSGQQGMEPLNDTLQQLKAHAVQVGCNQLAARFVVYK
jgi:ribonucleoside-diphosphate reductase alpha chain